MSAHFPAVDRALVVFCDRTEVWWLRLMRPGFRHCFVALHSAFGWVVLEAMSHRTSISLYVDDCAVDLAEFYRMRGMTVVEVRPGDPPARMAPWRPYTCVEEVKRVLGIHAAGVHTPWQLYRYLKKMVDGGAS